MPSKEDQEERDIINDDERERKVRIRKRRYHPSTAGRRCVNAVTGLSYPWQTGAYDEMRLYKVFDSTSYYTKEGFLRELKDPINKEGNMLYFDSPEQYATHMRVNINLNYCSAWHDRIDKIFPDGKFNRVAYEEYKSKCKKVPTPELMRCNDPDEV